ncbi:MAG: hypothetical protein ACK4K4_05800, partial [Caldimicrobium sp.]
MKKVFTKTIVGISFIVGGALISHGLNATNGNPNQDKPIILKTCAVSGCHQASPSVLRGNAVSVSMKAELLQ